MTSPLPPSKTKASSPTTLGQGQGAKQNASAPYSKVHRQAQPHGEDGIRFSLKKVCLMIAEGRLHPDVIAWTRKKLALAGNPKGPKARAKVLLDALRAQSGWVPDPVDAEFMPAANLMTGDGDKPPFFALGDCFAAGTLVLTDAHQLLPIEQLQEGMKIWGLDRWSVVERVRPKGFLSVDRVHLDNGTCFETTDEHHAYVLDCHEHPMLNRDAAPKALPARQTPEALVAPGCACGQAIRVEKRVRVSELRPGMVLPMPAGGSWQGEGWKPRLDPSAMRRVRLVETKITMVACWDITTDDGRVYLPANDVTVSQCDDLTIALGSAIVLDIMMLASAESVGAKAAVVGHAYGPDRMIEHVLGAIYDPNDNLWYYVDPSLKDVEFGGCRPFTRERVYLVPSAELLCDDRVCLKPGGRAAGAPPQPRRGDFVSVSGADDDRPDAPELEYAEMPSWLEGPHSSHDGRDMAATLPTYCDITGICEATVTYKPAATQEAIINQGVFELWMHMDPAAQENPLNWCSINPPASTDYAAHDLYAPWNDGLEPKSGADWLIPHSGR